VALPAGNLDELLTAPRNGVAHRGDNPSPEQARAVIDTARAIVDLLQHAAS
jgi:hypothetical protein